jgi:hypothetical protein
MIRAIQFQNKRTGSTFLQKAIDSHPQIIGVDEVFVNMAKKLGMKKSGFTPYVRSGYAGYAGSYLRKVIWNRYPDRHIIFKLMYNQILYHKGLIEIIEGRKMPVIHLMRHNLVKQVISGHTAATTKHDPISITPQDLLYHVESADKRNKQWQNRLKNHKKLELFYPDIIGEKKDEFTFVEKNANMDICNFFGVENIPMYTDTKKKNKESIWVYLKNREEIEKIFKGTKYMWMITEDI